MMRQELRLELKQNLEQHIELELKLVHECRLRQETRLELRQTTLKDEGKHLKKIYEEAKKKSNIIQFKEADYGFDLEKDLGLKDVNFSYALVDDEEINDMFGLRFGKFLFVTKNVPEEYREIVAIHEFCEDYFDEQEGVDPHHEGYRHEVAFADLTGMLADYLDWELTLKRNRPEDAYKRCESCKKPFIKSTFKFDACSADCDNKLKKGYESAVNSELAAARVEAEYGNIAPSTAHSNMYLRHLENARELNEKLGKDISKREQKIHKLFSERYVPALLEHTQKFCETWMPHSNSKNATIFLRNTGIKEDLREASSLNEEHNLGLEEEIEKQLKKIGDKISAKAVSNARKAPHYKAGKMIGEAKAIWDYLRGMGYDAPDKSKKLEEIERAYLEKEVARGFSGALSWAKRKGYITLNDLERTIKTAESLGIDPTPHLEQIANEIDHTKINLGRRYKPYNLDYEKTAKNKDEDDIRPDETLEIEIFKHPQVLINHFISYIQQRAGKLVEVDSDDSDKGREYRSYEIEDVQIDGRNGCFTIKKYDDMTSKLTLESFYDPDQPGPQILEEYKAVLESCNAALLQRKGKHKQK